MTATKDEWPNERDTQRHTLTHRVANKSSEAAERAGTGPWTQHWLWISPVHE